MISRAQLTPRIKAWNDTSSTARAATASPIESSTEGSLYSECSSVRDHLTADLSSRSGSRSEGRMSTSTPVTQISDAVSDRHAAIDSTNVEKGQPSLRQRSIGSSASERELSTISVGSSNASDISIEFAPFDLDTNIAEYVRELEAKEVLRRKEMRREILERRSHLLRRTLEKIMITIPWEHIVELANGRCSIPPFGLETLKVIEEAAQFFFAGQIENEAFALHFILWALHSDSPAPSERRLSLLKSCAVTAHSSEDLELVRDILLEEISRVRLLPNTELDLFLLQTVFTVIYRKITMLDARALKDQLWESTRKFQDVERFLTTFREGSSNHERRIQLDLHNFYLLNFAYQYLPEQEEHFKRLCNCPGRCLVHHTRSLDLQILKGEFLKQSPGTFEICNGNLGNPSLRACIAWCRTAFNKKFQRAGQLAIIRHMLGEAERADHIWIYWHLWSLWQIQKDRPGHPLSWDEDKKRFLGITAPELLFQLTGLVLSLSSPTVATKRTSISLFQDPVDLVKQRCLKGLDVISQMRDEQLAESFLSYHVSFHESPRDQEFSGTARSEFTEKTQARKAFQGEGYLGGVSADIFLDAMNKKPKLPEATGAPSKRLYSAFISGSRNPTLKSSDTGSTLSSLKKRKSKMPRFSVMSSGSGGSGFTRMTTAVDDLSDTMSLFTISVPILENAALDERAAEYMESGG